MTLVPASSRGGTFAGSAAGGDLAGTYPDPGIAGGAIVNADVNAAAAIAASKFAGFPSDASKALFGDGAWKNAATLTGGLVPPGQMATGTPGASKVLRGDQVWADVGKLYDFTISGAAQASIDTAVDGTTVADFSGFDVLEIWIVARTNDAGASAAIDLIFNNDVGAKYDRQAARGINVTASAVQANAATSVVLGAHGAGGRAGVAAITRVSIPGYEETTFEKIGEYTTSRGDSAAAEQMASVNAVLFRDTAAITRVKVSAQGAALLVIGSRLIVYGR